MHVSDWNQFDSAFKDSDVDQIVLDNDINVDKRGGDKIVYDQRGIARNLVITSAGDNQYSLNFNRHFMGLFDQNQNKGTDWNLVFKNVNITSTNNTFAPIFTRNVNVKYSKRDTITFDNVNFKGHQLAQTDAVNVVLAGNVNIDSTLEGGDENVIFAHSVKMADGANVNVKLRQASWVANDTTWNVGGSAFVRTMYNDSNDAVVIGSGANFKFNPDQTYTNIKGFVFADKANMIIADGAHVEMNMDDGNSTAILAPRELEVRPNAVLDIRTKQDNAGKVAWGGDVNLGTHVAPISIGNYKYDNGNSSFTIDKDATVRIVRQKDGVQTITPLISFGSTTENVHNVYNFNVKDGATLDLQDGAQGTRKDVAPEEYAPYLGKDSNVQTMGMIAMFGIRSEDHVNFGNVKYVNLQRTDYQHGNLLRLEGGHDISGSNAAIINGDAVPLAQWQADNFSNKADFTWDINHLHTENKMGNYTSNYNLRGQSTGKVSNWRQFYDKDTKFDQSTSTVAFTDGKSVEQHQSFNNNFSWWKARRIVFGTVFATPVASISDSNALTTHVNANVNQSPSLNTDNIVLTWKDSSGNTVKAPKNYTINWVAGPDTSVATKGDLNRSGKVEITVNGKTQEVVVPVRVLGAVVKNEGAKVNQNDPSTLPSAADMTDTTAVDRFGIGDITWSREPDISVPKAESYGQVQVNYDDGTYQVLNPYVDVIGVEDGRDHKDNKDLYRVTPFRQRYIDYNGKVAYKTGLMVHYRIKYTDYEYPVGDPQRVTLTKWIVEKN
ncbi:pectate lyase-like adhesive domain-containing protein [Lactobacillus xujianguonis]|uniref:pectate lyase-like adhesive domain-containing protein n=1 Tax=Lactobacillus xujianguonis TaxID=2495899 RepID=UPI0031BB066F